MLAFLFVKILKEFNFPHLPILLSLLTHHTKPSCHEFMMHKKCVRRVRNVSLTCKVNMKIVNLFRYFSHVGSFSWSHSKGSSPFLFFQSRGKFTIP